MDDKRPEAEHQPHYLRLFARVILVQIVTLTMLWILQTSFGRS